VKALGLEPRTYGLKVACPDAENTANQGVSDSTGAVVAPRVAPNPTDPDVQRVVEAWPALPEALRRAVLALIGSTAPDDFAAAFDRAFARLDRENGDRNFLSFVALRQALSGVQRVAFDAGLDELRRAGKYTLSSAEGRHGITDTERAAGIREDGQLLLYVSRRQQ
jgi:hypothetical protein